MEIARIDRELADLETPSDAPAVYSTAPGGALPPGRSRRWLRDHAREIPGATRIGGKRGRDVAWLVRRDEYERWLESQARPVASAPAESTPDVDDWLEAGGERFTRRSA